MDPVERSRSLHIVLSRADLAQPSRFRAVFPVVHTPYYLYKEFIK